MNKHIRVPIGLPAIVVLIVAWRCGTSHAAIRPAAIASAAELRQILANSLRALQCVHVKYRANSQLPNPSGAYVERELIAKSPCFLYEHAAHGSNRVDYLDDPFQQTAWVGRDTYYNEFPLERAYFYDTIGRGDRLPGTLDAEIWFRLTGCWPLAGRVPPLTWGTMPMLNVIARSTAYSIVHPTLEAIDGHWCHVLSRDDAADTLWLDANRGCCLLRRELREVATGHLLGRIDLSDHKEIVRGIWLPTRVRNRLFSWNAGEARARIDSVLCAAVLDGNTAADSEFVFHARPGSYSSSNLSGPNHQWRQTEPGGLDYLDDLVGWAERVYAFNDFRKRPNENIVNWAAVGFAACSIAILERRRMRRAVVRTEQSGCAAQTMLQSRTLQ